MINLANKTELIVVCPLLSAIWDEKVTKEIYSGTVALLSEFCVKTDIFCDDKTTHGYWNKDHNAPTTDEVAFTDEQKLKLVADELFFWEHKIYDPKAPPTGVSKDPQGKPIIVDGGIFGVDYFSDTGLPPKSGDHIYARRLIVNHHQLAFQLAINHTLAEIQRLYDATANIQFPVNNLAGNDTSLKLHDIFLLSKGSFTQNDFANHNIKLDTLYDKNIAGGILK